ncbi:tape measure protein [Aerococcaceae bacterium DSM 111020]|nr:tape measure protein [Aerococcaceae bacterium DSM 111020]
MSNLTVTAKLNANVSDFKSGINDAKSALDNLSRATANGGDGLKGIGRRMFGAQVAANAVSKAFSVVGNEIGALGGELNSSTKSWRTFEGNMQSLGRSPQQINKAKRAMQDFATKTIYSASDMATTYSQMASIWEGDTERLVKGMGGLAASAENPKQAMKTMSQQMTQALTKPQLQWQDFKLMLEQAPAGMAAVAKEMGMSLDDLVASIQDGEISSRDFANAVAKVGTNEQYSKMAEQFKTVDEAMDGLRETVANKLLPAFEKLSDKGIKAISKLSDAIDDFDFDGFKKGFKDFFSDIGSGAKNPFEGLVKKINKGIDSLKKIDIAKELDGWKNKAIKGVQKALDFGENLGNALSESISKIDWKSLGGAIGEGITNLWYDIPEFFSELDVKGIYNSAKKLTGSIAQVITNAFEGMWDGILLTEGALEEWNALKKFDSELSNIEFNGDFGKLWSDVQSAWDSAMASVNFEFDWNDILPDLSWDDSLISNWEMDWNAPLESLRSLWEEFKSSVKEIFSETDWFELPEFSWGEWSIDWPEFDLSGFENPIPKIIEMVSGWFSNFSWPSFSWPEFNLPELNISMIELGENPLEKVKETVSGWFSGFSWPSFSWPKFNIPKISFPKIELPDNPLTAVIDTVKGWFSNFSWPEFSWPEFNWPDLSSIFGGGSAPESQTISSSEVSIGEVNVTASSVNTEGITSMIESSISSIDFSGSFSNIGDSIGTSLTTSIQTAMTTVQTSIQTLATTIGTTLQTSLSTAFSTLGTTLATTMATAFSTIGTTISTGLVVPIQTAMAQVTTVAQSAMQSLASAVQSGVSQAVSSAGQFSKVTSTIQSALAPAPGIASAIMSATAATLASGAGAAQSAGAQMGAGFLAGLSSMEGAIVAKASSIASAAASAMRAALDIHSPSRVTEKLGGFTGEGFVIGLANMTKKAYKVAREFALAAVPQIDDASLNYRGAVSMDHDISGVGHRQGQLNSLISAMESGQVVTMDGYVVGQVQNRYNDENMAQNTRFNERWAW